MKRKLGSLAVKQKNLKDTLNKIHTFKKIKVISVELEEDFIVMILEWNEFKLVFTKKNKYPPAYTKQFFSSKGLKL